MAKKKLRQRLLGSTKTGRLVRAASLAGVLGGGGYLLSRRKSSVPTPPTSSAAPLALAPAKSSRPLGDSGAKNPRKHSNRVSTVPGLSRKVDRLRSEKSSLSSVASKKASRSVNKGIKDQILAAKARVKQIPKDSRATYEKLNRKLDRRRGGWVSPVNGTRRTKRRRA